MYFTVYFSENNHTVFKETMASSSFNCMQNQCDAADVNISSVKGTHTHSHLKQHVFYFI